MASSRERVGAGLPPVVASGGFASLLLYQLVFSLVFCAYSPVLLWRLTFDRRYRGGLRERVGLVPRSAAHTPVVWIHAVSVGELKAARQMIEALACRVEEFEVVVSSTTPTGRALARQLYPQLRTFCSTDIEEALVLDLFAGTGGVGIEALSRGAARAVFVEGNRTAVSVSQENLRATGLGQRAQVVRSDVFLYLRNDPSAGFDFIHIAPPQYKNLWADTLTTLDTRPAWLNPDGVAIAQIDPREFTELSLQNLTLVDKRKYGSTLLCFYERIGE